MLDLQPVLVGETLRLDPLTEADLPALAEAAADPLIWEQHPEPERWRAEVFAPYGRYLLERGGTLVAREIEGGAVVGCSRYYEPVERPGGWGIGYTFLVRRLWGGAANGEMKRLMLTHAFRQMDEVWFDIGAENLRSQRATAKLGAVLEAESISNLHGTPKPYQHWRLTRQTWEARAAAAQ